MSTRHTWRLRTDKAAKEMLAAMVGMTREQIWAAYDLTEVVAGVELELYLECDEYADRVLDFVLEGIA